MPLNLSNSLTADSGRKISQKFHRRFSKLDAEEAETWKESNASAMARSMKASVMRRDGCSLYTEFINATFAALRRASAFVGQS